MEGGDDALFRRGPRPGRTQSSQRSWVCQSIWRNCFSCHVPATAQWDLVCEIGHGCAPLPVTRAMIGALQRTDPRRGNHPISPDDAEAIKQLEQLLKAPGVKCPRNQITP